MFIYNLLLTLHMIFTIVLVLVILLQTGKGADIGAVFGGGGAVFGSVGATTFLHKLTIGLAAAFMATSLLLAIIAPRQSKTIFKPIAETAAPAALPADAAIPSDVAPAAAESEATPAPETVDAAATTEAVPAPKATPAEPASKQ